LLLRFPIEHRRRTVHLQILDHRHCISVLKEVAIRITPDALRPGLSCCCAAPHSRAQSGQCGRSIYRIKVSGQAAFAVIAFLTNRLVMNSREMVEQFGNAIRKIAEILSGDCYWRLLE
jgi:hypothetical protein